MAAYITSQLPEWKEVEKYPEGNICLQESSPGGQVAVTGGGSLASSLGAAPLGCSARLLRVF